MLKVKVEVEEKVKKFEEFYKGWLLLWVVIYVEVFQEVVFFCWFIYGVFVVENFQRMVFNKVGDFYQFVKLYFDIFYLKVNFVIQQRWQKFVFVVVFYFEIVKKVGVLFCEYIVLYVVIVKKIISLYVEVYDLNWEVFF